MALCIPEYGWVPHLSGPPDWISGAAAGGNPNLNDPRWVGALRVSADAGSGEKFTVRAVRNGSQLFLSVLVQVDPSPAFQVADRLWIGLNPSLAGGTPRVLRFNYNNTSDEQNSSALSLQLYEWNGAAWTAVMGVPAWLSNQRVWKEIGASRSWAYQMVIDTVGAGLTSAAAPTAAYGMFFQARVEAPAAMIANYRNPTSMPIIAPSAAEPTGLAVVSPGTASHWQQFSSGAACDPGVWIDPTRIGTTNAIPHQMKLNSVNTFRARPRNDSSAQVSISARFRLANWGSTPESNWRQIGAVTPAGAINASSDGQLDMTWRPDPAIDVQLPTPPGGTLDERTFYTANPHQCMMVELEAIAGTVSFSRSSCVRNMDFVPGSKFTRAAEISVRELNDGFPLPQRDVYVYVERVNMPEQIDRLTIAKYRKVQDIYQQVLDIEGDITEEQRALAILEGDLRHLRYINIGDVVGWARGVAEAGLLVVRGTIADILQRFDIEPVDLYTLLGRYEPQIRQFIEGLTYDAKGQPQLDPRQRAFIRDLLSRLEYRGEETAPELTYPPIKELEEIMPTVRYHVFHDSGLRTQVNGAWRPIVTPQPSFGYHVWLDHDVQQWELRLQNAEKVGQNLYVIRPPTNGAVTVVTSIHAVEPGEQGQIEPPEVIVPLPTYKANARDERDGGTSTPQPNGCLEAVARFLEGLGPVGKSLAQLVRSFASGSGTS